MGQSNRPYDPSSPSDKAWSAEVYQKAKGVIEEVLLRANAPVSSADIDRAMKQKYPMLCDDTIRNRQQHSQPEWEHKVANAVNALKSAKKLRKADGGWIWGGGGPPPPPVVQPPPIITTTPQSPPPPQPGIRQGLRDKLLQLTPSDFEQMLGKLLEAIGLREVRVTGRAHDGGIDGDGVIPVLELKVAFQAKKWALGNNVGSEPVRSLIGSVVTRRYDRGLFITTSSFTPGAREEAERPDSRIVLMDGDRLVDLMLEKGLGVKRTPVVKEELDEEFFGS